MTDRTSAGLLGECLDKLTALKMAESLVDTMELTKVDCLGSQMVESWETNLVESKVNQWVVPTVGRLAGMSVDMMVR